MTKTEAHLMQKLDHAEAIAARIGGEATAGIYPTKRAPLCRELAALRKLAAAGVVRILVDEPDFVKFARA